MTKSVILYALVSSLIFKKDIPMLTTVVPAHHKPMRPNTARHKVEHLKKEVSNPAITTEKRLHLQNEINNLSGQLGLIVTM